MSWDVKTTLNSTVIKSGNLLHQDFVVHESNWAVMKIQFMLIFDFPFCKTWCGWLCSVLLSNKCYCFASISLDIQSLVIIPASGYMFLPGCGQKGTDYCMWCKLLLQLIFVCNFLMRKSLHCQLNWPMDISSCITFSLLCNCSSFACCFGMMDSHLHFNHNTHLNLTSNLSSFSEKSLFCLHGEIHIFESQHTISQTM